MVGNREGKKKVWCSCRSKEECQMYTSDRFRMLRQMGQVLMDEWGRVIVTLLSCVVS
jgi:hypothetical protein